MIVVILADFILARIDEEEREIREGHEPRKRSGPASRSEPDPNSTSLRRALAQCDARRQVVAACADALASAQTGSAVVAALLTRGGYGAGRDALAEKVLDLLARPYSDHPDYRKARFLSR